MHGKHNTALCGNPQRLPLGACSDSLCLPGGLFRVRTSNFHETLGVRQQSIVHVFLGRPTTPQPLNGPHSVFLSNRNSSIGADMAIPDECLPPQLGLSFLNPWNLEKDT